MTDAFADFHLLSSRVRESDTALTTKYRENRYVRIGRKTWIFRCIHASLKEGPSVRPSVTLVLFLPGTKGMNKKVPHKRQLGNLDKFGLVWADLGEL